MEGVQIHYVVREADSEYAFSKISDLIKSSGSTINLIVIKYFTDCDTQYLSFPQNGFAVSIDVKSSKNIKSLIKNIIDTVIDLNGRIYLAKDSSLSKGQFSKIFDKEEFREVVIKYNKKMKFSSDAAQRYDLN
tara:strand:- start:374 stop:772 length:399 start_codon:yes stop_codon:yes gene_type:complete